jgi:hypothetical protein
MHVAAVPDERAASNPNGRCLADGRREHDNANFAADVRRVSAWLAEGGVGPGDVVAVALPNCVELITTMFAAWRLGAALTPLNPRSRRRRRIIRSPTRAPRWSWSTRPRRRDHGQRRRSTGSPSPTACSGSSDFRRAFTSYCRLRS